jgi:hypothetical protein
MADLILAGVLTWLQDLRVVGTDLALRAGRRGKMIGAFFIVLALVPSGIALWLGT